MNRYKRSNYLRTSQGRYTGTDINEDRYDEEYNPKFNGVSRGVQNVGLPDNLSQKELKEYIKKQSGPVKTYKIKK